MTPVDRPCWAKCFTLLVWEVGFDLFGIGRAWVAVLVVLKLAARPLRVEIVDAFQFGHVFLPESLRGELGFLAWWRMPRAGGKQLLV
eukprot:389330-Pleurochrysis_carterae.AAC.5